MYRHIEETWQKVTKENYGDIRARAISWRKDRAIIRVDKPSKLQRARALGYKAKKGFAVVRVRVGRGGMRRKRPVSGRRPKHLGVTRMRADVSMQQVAGRRAIEKYPNLKFLGSYFVHKDGKYLWYEVVMVDPLSAAVASDKNLKKTLPE
ncbi:MAG: 50S ribosomal protein L15e [Thaumarchaeota archaeon]|nr:50S ribosomal protein L15e [Nitrososphaerota archaeon]